MIIHWTINPLNPPAVIRYCSKCGCQSRFQQSGRFRVNAQQKKLDVWLIYKCAKCDCTWNMEIYARISPNALDAGLYEGFLKNSADLAVQYAFDAETLSKNSAVPCYDHAEYEIEGEDVTLEMLRRQPVDLILQTRFSLPVRLDKLLSEQMGISRTLCKTLFQKGAVTCGGKGAGNGVPRLKNGVTLHFDAASIRKILGEDNHEEIG